MKYMFADVVPSAHGITERLRTGVNDAVLIDEALAALLAQYRVAVIDAAYGAYDAQPLDQLDEWGDLASFREAAGSS